MKYLFWLFFVPLIVFGQSNLIKGTISVGIDSTVIVNAFVTIEQLNLTTKSDSTGSFLFKDIPDGNYIFKIIKYGLMIFQSNPILVANDTTCNLKFHIDEIIYPILGPVTGKQHFLWDDTFSSSYDDISTRDLIELKFYNTLDNVLNKNANVTLIYQKYSDGLFLYNGAALENNIYLDDTKISGINPELFAHLINTDFLSGIEIIGNYGSNPCDYPEAEKINLRSNFWGSSKANFFASNKNLSSNVSFNGTKKLSSNLLEAINYFFSYTKSVNINKHSKDNNVDFPNANFDNFYGASRFVINPSQDFNLSYFLLDSDFKVTENSYSNQNSLNNYPKNINLKNINFHSTTFINKDQFIDLNFTYNKCKEYKSTQHAESNNSTTTLTSYIRYMTHINSEIRFFRIGYHHNYYITNFSNMRNFDRDHTLRISADLQYYGLSIDPIYRLVYYDKNKFLSLPGINLAYLTSDNSRIIFNYSVGYNKRNAETSIEYEYGDIYNWKTFSKYRPELYKNLSITFKYTDFKLYTIELSAYQMRYENIAKSELQSNTTSIFYRLTGYENITTNGSDLKLSIGPIEEFTFAINYTLQDIKDSQSKNLRLRPNHSGFATLQYKSYSLDLNAAIELRYYGSKYAPTQYTEYSNLNVYDVNEYKTSDALITNIYLEKELLRGLTLTIGANNIFNHKTENYCSYQSIEYFLKINIP